jgi:hypothetical protein
LGLGQSATCTITNDDIAPTLKVVKTIVNDNGGTVTDPNAFGLRIDGTPILHDAVTAVAAGNHTLSEVGLSGYAAGSWGGDCNPDGTINLALDQDATCTLTNNDVAPSLTLVKVVTKDNGGTAVPANWTLTASGPTPFSGSGAGASSGPSFDAGTYNLSESGPTGYSASAWVCTGVTQDDADTVTLGLGQSATCTITNDDIAPTLKIVKTIVNDNGGTVTDPNAFGLRIDGTPVLNNAVTAVSAGNHTLSEVGLAGYVAGSWGGDCNPDGSITLALGQDATCTITNDDVAPSLTLVKAVIKDNGGTATPASWTLTATGPTGFSGSGPSVSNGPSFDAGSYDLSESGPAGYEASDWVCVGGSQDDADTVTLGLGQSATCTITNDDIAPSLTLVKAVTKDNGGTAVPSDWMLIASGPTGFSGSGAGVSSGASFDAGTYNLSESGPAGYSASAWVCTGVSQDDADTLTLGLGQSATCTITNDDIEPSLTLVKEVTNNNDGTAAPADWTLTATGPAGFSGPGPSVSNGGNFQAGSYTLSESDGPEGYRAGDWICTGGEQTGLDTVTVRPGESVTCTIVNDDNGTGLTLVKKVVNDNGGTAVPANWTLTAAGPTGFSGNGPSVSNAPGFNPGTYALSETGPAGYTASGWSCVGGTQNGANITLALDESAVCTNTSDDAAPSLTLVKHVTNNNGDSAVPAHWTLTAAGPTGFSGSGAGVSSGPSFDAGTYNLSESGPAGYSASAWVCSGVTQDDADTLTLGLGQSATCTITNDDIAPTLKIVKSIVNDNGGTVTDPNAFGLRIDGALVQNDTATVVAAGNHTLSEDGLPGYRAGDWGGACNADGSITLSPGQDATCTLTNDDTEPGLTLVKVVVNNSGGSASASDWTLTASGPTGFSGPGPEVSSGPGFASGTYHLSESDGPAGYSAGDWSCVGGTQQDADTVILAPGESAICTIVNDDLVLEDLIFSNGFETD